MRKPKGGYSYHFDPNLSLIFNSSVRVFSFVLFIFLSAIPQVFAIDINSCQNITSPGTYILTQDVSSDGTCFNIQANNVTLDCQGHTIYYANSLTGYGMNITGYNFTTIKNCKIQQVNSDVWYVCGIYLKSSSYNNITNVSINTISSRSAGLFLDSSSNYNTVINNTIIGSSDGVDLDSSSYNIFTNNTITSTDRYSVFFFFSPYNTLEGNKINKGVQGLYIEGSSLEDFQQNISSTNTINGKPIYYRSDIYGGCPTSVDTSTYSWVGIVNCANVNITGTFSNSLDHLLLANTNRSNITGFNVTGGYSGLYLFSSSNNILTNNNIVSIGLDSVDLYYSYNNTFINNTFTTIDIQGIGLFLYYSSYNIFTNNTITAKRWWGAWLSSSSYNTFTNNTITANSDGAYLDSSSNNNFTNNFITSMAEAGVYLSESSDNMFYNNLINGTPSVSFDGTIYPNFWNTTLDCNSGPNIVGGQCIGGNFYATSTGEGFSQTCSDTNNDGICDSPSSYTLETNNIDYLPLAGTIPSFSNNLNQSNVIHTPTQNESSYTPTSNASSHNIFEEYGLWILLVLIGLIALIFVKLNKPKNI
jgi:parallel beta-helix repeat protein